MSEKPASCVGCQSLPAASTVPSHFGPWLQWPLSTRMAEPSEIESQGTNFLGNPS